MHWLHKSDLHLSHNWVHLGKVVKYSEAFQANNPLYKFDFKIKGEPLYCTNNTTSLTKDIEQLFIVQAGKVSEPLNLVNLAATTTFCLGAYKICKKLRKNFGPFLSTNLFQFAPTFCGIDWGTPSSFCDAFTSYCISKMHLLRSCESCWERGMVHTNQSPLSKTDLSVTRNKHITHNRGGNM